MTSDRGAATALVTRVDDGGVAHLRLNRPDKRNALSTALLVELRDHLAAVEADRSVRVVLLTGAGPAFSAGADLHEFGPDAPAAPALARIRLVVEVLRRIGELERPTLAAVHGPAAGAGWGLALACDLCFAAGPATFSLPEVSKGLRLPAVIGARLAQIVGPVRAAEIIFTGREYDAAGALAAGWVTRVLPTADGLADGARDFCASLASRPARALAAAKRPLRQLAPTTPFPPPELVWTEE